MSWGLFFILLGALILLDRWDIYYGGFFSKLVISGLIAWGGSILLGRVRRAPEIEAGAVGAAEIESTTASTDSPG